MGRAGFGQPFTGWKVQRHGTAVCAGRRTGEGQAVRRGGQTGWAMRGQAEWRGVLGTSAVAPGKMRVAGIERMVGGCAYQGEG